MIKKGAPLQLFICDFCKISQSSYSKKNLLMAASEEILKEELMPKLHPCFLGISLVMLCRKWLTPTLHKKWSFPLRASSVNVTNSAVYCDLVTITEEIRNGKLHFLCSESFVAIWSLSRSYEVTKLWIQREWRHVRNCPKYFTSRFLYIFLLILWRKGVST